MISQRTENRVCEKKVSKDAWDFVFGDILLGCGIGSEERDRRDVAVFAKGNEKCYDTGLKGKPGS